MGEGRIPHVDETQLAALVSMQDAIAALEGAYAAGEDRHGTRERTVVEVAGGDLLMMPSADARGVGVKLVTVCPLNREHGRPLVQGVYVMFAPDTLAPVAMIDGAALTALRTAAVSGLATRHLAAGSRSLCVFGAGRQARSHVQAMLAVCDVEHVTIVGRTPAHAAALAEEVAQLQVTVSTGAPEDVARADLVCTCTASDTPILRGAWVAPGTHVNAIGAYRPDARELDSELVTRARIVVERREAALAEAGDLLIPIREGAMAAADVAADLGEVCRGAQVRCSPADVTVFKSVGSAFADLVVAHAAVVRLGS